MAGDNPSVISRVDARAIGRVRFFTRIACRNGHLSERLVSDGKCIKCVQFRQRRHYRERPVVAKSWRSRYLATHAAEHYQRTRKWQKKNVEIVRISKVNAERRRRAKKFAAGGIHSQSDMDELFKLQNGCCVSCRKKLGTGRSRHVDHIIPLARGGDNGRRNLQILCMSCNSSKHARDPIEFMQSRGFLL